MMRFLLVTSLFAIFDHCSQGVDAWELRTVNIKNHRKLQQGYDFLISNASPEDDLLCITAMETKIGGNLELQSCDFLNAPPGQLWLQDGNKFASDLGNGIEYCMIVNHGNNVFDGVRMRLGACDDSLTNFTWNDGGSEFLQVLDAENYCLTNTGPIASSGDKIHAKPCQDRADYRWSFTANDPREDSFSDPFVLFEYESSLCVQPQSFEESAVPPEGSKIILDECSVDLAWYTRERNGAVSFHSAIDTNLCMQAGYSANVKDGTKMRLMNCDIGEDLQNFAWGNFEAPIKLAGHDDLCMVYLGITPETGDNIIMKECEDRFYTWSEDTV